MARASPGSCWLVKSDPSEYAWDDLARDGRTAWGGVRSFAARSHLAAMRRGDLVLVYHSQADKAVVGIARVARAAYPDPTAPGEDWVAVDLEPLRPLAKPVGLGAIKADPALRGIALVRQPRLSVMPLPRAAFERILALGGMKPPR
jgi:predicted RNA-binding protein with PUA-like domain